jgi:RNA polymerase primary sigma factor
MVDMAYLTEHLSRQDHNAVNAKLDAVVHKPISQGAGSSQLSNEHCNFEIARRLNEEKANLINALSQYPVTALLLLNKHEKMADIAEQDDEMSLASDLSSALGEIKRCYSNAMQAFSDPKLAAGDYTACKNDLALALRAFPYSFEELNKISEVIVLAYKFRGFADQFPLEGTAKQLDLLKKRLESRKRGNNGIVSMASLFRSLDVFDYDEAFLLLPAQEMHGHLLDIVVAENRWLAARQQLAEANNKLVLFIANQYKAGFLDFEDLVQEGQTGLLKAVDRFDYRLGFQFSTYAGYWIRQAISRSLSRCERLVRVPCGQVANINRVFRAKNELMARTGLEPSVKELSEHTKLSHDDINMILSISQTVMALEGNDDDEEAFAPIDFIEQQIFSPAFNDIAESDLEKLLDCAIESLNTREAKVICNHFGVDTDKEQTLQEIGMELNLTRERVRQIQVIALNKIKMNFGQQLMCFL